MMEILSAAILLAVLGASSALLLLYSHRRWPRKTGEVVDRIEDLLPRTQCAQCGYPGCRPYAEAVVNGEAINRCPPGGPETIDALAALLGRDSIAPDASLGEHPPGARAIIREPECIGCTLCIRACPVDAIVGASRMMHTVIGEECTGCELCIPPCPVNCIDLVPSPVNRKVELPVPEQPCIHCHLCMTACPKDLAPQQLLFFRESTDVADSLGLDHCVECRICDRVCPAEIPLTDIFIAMKTRHRAAGEERKRARQVAKRVESHELRLRALDNRVRKRPSKAEITALLGTGGNRHEN